MPATSKSFEHGQSFELSKAESSDSTEHKDRRTRLEVPYQLLTTARAAQHTALHGSLQVSSLFGVLLGFALLRRFGFRRRLLLASVRFFRSFGKLVETKDEIEEAERYEQNPNDD